MATSPNFNWPEPDNTDLVKNGALAIRTAVDAIDTSLVDLKGGTTGQVLAKASNTDMDFVWSADAAGISPTIFAAKGDLLGASANDTPAILSVGNNGETLVADSSTSTGLRYNPQNALANPVINGGFDIWQRGTSSAVTSSSYTYFGTDRWQTYRGSTGGTISRQVTGDTTNLPNIQYCMRVQRDSGTSSTSFFQPINNFESINSIPFAGKTVTFSFYARAGANYSAASNGLNGFLITGTGTDQNANFGYTGGATQILVSATLTTTWQRFTGTATLPATTTQIGVGFSFTPTGTAGANDYFEVTGVQVDLGTYTATTAPTFRRNGATIQGELAACQRYLPVLPISTESFGYCYAVNAYVTNFKFPVTARVAPTGITVNNISNTAIYNNFNVSAVPSAITLNSAGTSIESASLLTTGTGTAGNVGRLATGSSSSIFFTGCEL
jgi:hypothetical protein